MSRPVHNVQIAATATATGAATSRPDPPSRSASTTPAVVGGHAVPSRPTLPVRTTKSVPAHQPLYRRLLFPHALEGDEVALLVDGKGAEIGLINERLHNLVALALRAYVLSWYTRFSRDRTLLPAIHQSVIRPTLSPILNDIHQDPSRLCDLILLDLPCLLGLHWRTYWDARTSCMIVRQDGGVGTAYHARLPLLSVVPTSAPKTNTNTIAEDRHGRFQFRDAVDGEETSTYTDTYALSTLYYSALASALLSPPTSDSVSEAKYQSEPQPDVQRYISREILTMIFLSVGRKLSQAWFYHALLVKFLGEPGDPSPFSRSSRSRSRSRSSTPGFNSEKAKTIPELLWGWAAHLVGLVVGIWSLGVGLTSFYTASPARKDKYERCWEPTVRLLREMSGVDAQGRGRGRPGDTPRGSGWTARLAWGGVEMVLLLFGPVLDRLLPHLVHTYVLTPGVSLEIIDLLQRLLFPDGYPVPSPPDPSAEECASLKIRAEKRLGEVIPRPIQMVFFPSHRYAAADLIEPLEDASCNTHLMAMLIDALIATLRPDLVVESLISEQQPSPSAGAGVLGTEA